jgi:hypothetical protein
MDSELDKMNNKDKLNFFLLNASFILLAKESG